MTNLESSIQPEAVMPHMPTAGALREDSYAPASNRFMIRGLDEWSANNSTNLGN